MGILKDMFDTVRDMNVIGNIEDYFKKKKYSSVAKRSQEGILQFPVIISKSMDIDTCMMISKALERNYSSFMQVVLTMNPFLDVKNEKDVSNYLRKFHQNSDTKTDMFDAVNFFNDVAEECFNLYESADGNVTMAMILCEGSTGPVIFDNKEKMRDVLEGVRQDILNNKYIPQMPRVKFLNESLNSYFNNKRYRPVTESRDVGRDNAQFSGRDIHNNNHTQTGDNHMTYGEVQNMNVTIRGGGGSSMGRFGQDSLRQELPKDILRNNDVHKSNELVPTTLQIRTYLAGKDGDQQGYIDFIIGIKATLHPLSSDEIVSNMVDACRDNSKAFNLLRWTSGETDFFGDFLFNIKAIKTDVARRSGGSSHWWIALKRRRALAKVKNATFLPNQILPNAAIVLTMEEVEYIKATYGYDLMNTVFVDKIMKEFFLLSFVVVDNSSEVVHFMFDGQTAYQSISFSGLERENKSGGGSDIKEVLKLINRV